MSSRLIQRLKLASRLQPGRVALSAQSIRQDFGIKWEQALDLFVACADRSFDTSAKIFKSLKQALWEEDFKDIERSFVFKVTIVGIVFTLGVVLMSCQSTARRLPIPSANISGSTQKQDSENVYVKRDSMQILPKETSSEHGSIYAANRRPLNLFSEDAPQLPGDSVVIQIPEQLLFKPQSKKENGKDRQALTPTEKGKPKTDEEILKLLNTNPAQLASSDQSTDSPIQELKVQIIGIDQSGRVFLKGVKQFSGLASKDGRDSSIMLTASIPATALKSKNILATDLSQIEVSTLRDGKASLYQTDGWDLVVSRKLAGYAPDLDDDMQKLKEFQDEVTNEQQSLTQRFRSLKAEQSRFKKEQADFFEKMRRANERAAEQSNAQNNNQAAPPADTNTASPRAQDPAEQQR